jgi:transposase-like protein
MANYLRQDKRKELQVDRAWRRNEKDRNRSCPYCKSKSIEKSTRDWLCRNCHRHFRLE